MDKIRLDNVCKTVLTGEPSRITQLLSVFLSVLKTPLPIMILGNAWLNAPTILLQTTRLGSALSDALQIRCCLEITILGCA